jgi:hypothetical protein
MYRNDKREASMNTTIRSNTQDETPKKLTKRLMRVRSLRDESMLEQCKIDGIYEEYVERGIADSVDIRMKMLYGDTPYTYIILRQRLEREDEYIVIDSIVEITFSIKAICP